MTATPLAQPAPADIAITPLSSGQFALALTGALLCLAIGTLDGTALSTALPRISADFGDLAHLFWVNLAYGVPAVVMGPLYGKLRDGWGAKRLIYIAIGLFLAGSLLSGLAHSLAQLIAARAFQGVGGGGLSVLGHIIIGEVSPPSRRARSQALVSANFAIAASAGPVIGGLITDALGWRWVFYCSLPVALAGLAFITLGLKHASAAVPKRVDLAGFVAFALAAAGGLILLGQAGGSQTLLAPTIALIAVTILAAIAFVVLERRSFEPLFPTRVVRHGAFVRPALANGVLFASMQIQAVYMPLYFQAVIGLNAASSGLVMIGSAAGLFGSSFTLARWRVWVGRQKLASMIGVSILTAAYVAIVLGTVLGAPSLAFAVAFLIAGAGAGLAIPNMMAAAQNSVSNDDLGAATSVAALSRSLVPLAGVAAAGALLNTLMIALLGQGFVLTRALEDQLLSPRLQTAASTQLGALLRGYHGGLDGVALLSLVLALAAFGLLATAPRDG
jgi:MFS family permease